MVEKLVSRFISHISGFAFLVAAVADLGLNGLFYFSLGFDTLTKIVLILWAFVIVGAKVYGWASNVRFMAVSCAILSVVASVSIFLAVLDTQQANTAEATQTAVSVAKSNGSLDRQIAEAEKDIADKKSRRDATPQDQTTVYMRLDKAVTDANALLTSLRAEKSDNMNKKPDDAVKTKPGDPVHLNLDAWSIFRQLVGVDWKDAARVFALFFILGLATVLEIIIAYTTPRTSEIKIETPPTPEQVTPSRRAPSPITPKEIEFWVNLNWHRYTNGTADSILIADDFIHFVKSKNKRFPLRKFDELKSECIKKGLIDQSGKIKASKDAVLEALNK